MTSETIRNVQSIIDQYIYNSTIPSCYDSHVLSNILYDPFFQDPPSLLSIENSSNNRRHISKTAFKLLDAPGLADDFYLNLVDWSATNFLAVALEKVLYLWSGDTSSVEPLCEREKTVTSIAWSLRGDHIAMGSQDGTVAIYDAIKGKEVRCFSTSQKKRVGCIAWNQHLLATASRDTTVIVRDVRVPGDSASAVLRSHSQEVCGLKWAPDGEHLATGGNDNHVYVWNMRLAETPIMRVAGHKAAVKALAWSPHKRGILASGGGTADMRIQCWDTMSAECLGEIHTGSQVCALGWSLCSDEIVSTHGYSTNTVCIWKFNNPHQNLEVKKVTRIDACDDHEGVFTRLAALSGHTMRVLYLALAPDGESIATAAGDETVRFWKVFDSKQAKKRGYAGMFRKAVWEDSSSGNQENYTPLQALGAQRRDTLHAIR